MSLLDVLFLLGVLATFNAGFALGAMWKAGMLRRPRAVGESS